jgi:hypothetical protein
MAAGPGGALRSLPATAASPAQRCRLVEPGGLATEHRPGEGGEKVRSPLNVALANEVCSPLKVASVHEMRSPLNVASSRS